MKRSALTVIFGVVIGAAIGWFAHVFVAEEQLRAVLVARDLERVSFAVNTLNTQVNYPDKAVKLQLLILESSVDNLELLTRKPVHLRTMPSLRQALDRAGVYSRANGRADLTAKIDTIHRRLYGGA